MLDPVKNAKVIGIIFEIFAVLDLLSSLSSGVPILIGLSSGLLVVGFGLIRKKLWAVYGLGVLTLIRLVITILYVAQGEVASTGMYMTIVIFALLFFWFFSARKRFIK